MGGFVSGRAVNLRLFVRERRHHAGGSGGMQVTHLSAAPINYGIGTELIFSEEMNQ